MTYFFLFYAFAFFYSPHLPANEPFPIAVYLTWQQDPSTTMTIQWISHASQHRNEVCYWQSNRGEVLTVRAKEQLFPQGEPYLIHRVELHHLQPDTDYTFFLPGAKETYRFQTLPNTWSRPIRFVVGGDIFHDNIHCVLDMNRILAKRAPDFAILGGDLAYAAGKFRFFAQDAKRWLLFLRVFSDTLRTSDGRLIPWIPIIGNHDVTGRYDQSPAQAPFYYALFAMPGLQGYNVLDLEKEMSLIFLDSGHTHPIPGDQTEWIKETLRERSDSKHRFVFYHVPAFPSVRSYFNKRCIPVRKHWVPVFEEYGVDAAFEHHDHAYKRTHPLMQGKAAEGGVVYFGDGAWGVKNPRKPHLPSQLSYLAYSEGTQHLIFVTVDADKRQFEAVDTNNEVFDFYEQPVSLMQPAA